MKTLVVLLVLLAAAILGLALSGCASAEIPAAPASTIPLVEYSIDGEGWHGLTKGEVKNLSVSVVQIRKTEQGAEHKLVVKSDSHVPWFSGSLTTDEGIIIAEGQGALMIRIDRTDYAKIVLVPK